MAEMLRFCGACGVPFNDDSYAASKCLNCGQEYTAPKAAKADEPEPKKKGK